MKIIDFEKKGNAVRFFLGADTLKMWYGDDWDDTPYEHNAGQVYEEFVSGVCDIYFPFDDIVVEPANDWHNGGNTRWCKDDMRERRVPCIVVLPAEAIPENTWVDTDCFEYCNGSKDAVRFYMGDPITPGRYIWNADI